MTITVDDMRGMPVIIDSYRTYNCPRGVVDTQGSVVKVNSGYCRSSCEHRNYDTGTPGDNIVHCGKDDSRKECRKAYEKSYLPKNAINWSIWKRAWDMGYNYAKKEQ